MRLTTALLTTLAAFATFTALGTDAAESAADRDAKPGYRLIGFASLPPDTLAPGPPSGHLLNPAKTHGRTVPFDGQPVQGFSSVIATNMPGEFLALSDNGFGSKANSPDYLLRVYRVRPDFKTAEGGTGKVAWKPAFTLSDPDGRIPWPIVADRATYPGSDTPVAREVREGRLLTGADFDVESFVRLPDGTFWVGDEFGPFLLHVDAEGRLLAPPVDLVGVPGAGFQSPDHPRPSSDAVDLPRSAGFEGMAMREVGGGVALRPMLEKNGRVLDFYPDLAPDAVWVDADSRFAGSSFVRYPLTKGHAVGEFIAAESEYLVIERDGRQGDAARVKAIYRWSGRSRDESKRLVADLLNIPDPDDLDGDGTTLFRFPFVTIESVVMVDDRTLLIVNDNNYPLSSGRTPGQPDPTEFILLRFDKPLVTAAGR
ncbi:MAG: esterase-like activity of phytase family protein [Planctomycetota bacterium]